MKEPMPQEPPAERDFIAPKTLTTDEQIADLRRQIRMLELRIERLEEHSHGPDGKPVIRITRLRGAW